MIEVPQRGDENPTYQDEVHRTRSLKSTDTLRGRKYSVFLNFIPRNSTTKILVCMTKDDLGVRVLTRRRIPFIHV